MQTAHLSNKRKHGAVFLVSNIYAGDAAFAIACEKPRYKETSDKYKIMIISQITRPNET